MCLLMTAFAAVVFTVLWAMSKRRGKEIKSLRTALLMFWAAALMWSVDGAASVLGRGSFFDISVPDAVLGLIVLACGLCVFMLLFAREKQKAEK